MSNLVRFLFTLLLSTMMVIPTVIITAEYFPHCPHWFSHGGAGGIIAIVVSIIDPFKVMWRKP